MNITININGKSETEEPIQIKESGTFSRNIFKALSPLHDSRFMFETRDFEDSRPVFISLETHTFSIDLGDLRKIWGLDQIL